jgi:hypothetical protein
MQPVDRHGQQPGAARRREQTRLACAPEWSALVGLPARLSGSAAVPTLRPERRPAAVHVGEVTTSGADAPPQRSVGSRLAQSCGPLRRRMGRPSPSATGTEEAHTPPLAAHVVSGQEDRATRMQPVAEHADLMALCFFRDLVVNGN